MAEQIGLEAVFDLSSWSKNIGRYQSDMAGATGATSKAAGAIGKSWNQLGTTVGNVAKTMGVAIVAAGAAAAESRPDIKSSSDLKEFLTGLRDKMSEQTAAPIYALSAMNYVLSLPDIYRLLDDEIKTHTSADDASVKSGAPAVGGSLRLCGNSFAARGGSLPALPVSARDRGYRTNTEGGRAR